MERKATVVKYIIGVGTLRHYSYWSYDADVSFTDMIDEAKPCIISILDAQAQMAGADKDFVKKWNALTADEKNLAWIPYVSGTIYGSELSEEDLDWYAECMEPGDVVDEYCWKIMDF